VNTKLQLSTPMLFRGYLTSWWMFIRSMLLDDIWDVSVFVRLFYHL